MQKFKIQNSKLVFRPALNLIGGTASIISDLVVSPLPAAMYEMNRNWFWSFGGDAMNRVSTVAAWPIFPQSSFQFISYISTRIGRIFANLAALSLISSSALPFAQNTLF